MVTFSDGPAAGQSLALKRAPVMLRVVRNPAGEFDALDQLDDLPKSDEDIFLYVLTCKPEPYHVRARKPHPSGWFYFANYRLWPNPPERIDLADNRRWADWIKMTELEITKILRGLQPAEPPTRKDDPDAN